ncbi:hypothetical protein Vretifemale_6290 [Volvox reticuliferus]|uniref:Uncharacterized protein n=1 Tax=Volvox reticuliferus TaxID=1737510 RepID=A0A8J4C8A7_9CHLO|nr:hypothetical protein Vretifemale_6290 [Volvox reticuliferus]
MLRSSGLTRTALPRHTIVQICRKGSRSTVCRSAEQEVTTSITIAERPLIDDDVKMKATISALDSLLGSQDTALTSSSGVASSSSPSTSVPAPPRQPASSSPPGGIKLPSLPLGGDGSSNSSSTPRRKPAGLTFDQVMGFSGLAPEVINGRAASECWIRGNMLLFYYLNTTLPEYIQQLVPRDPAPLFSEGFNSRCTCTFVRNRTSLYVRARPHTSTYCVKFCFSVCCTAYPTHSPRFPAPVRYSPL